MFQLFTAIHHILMLQNPENKAAAVKTLYENCQSDDCHWDIESGVIPISEPGRPEKPVLVAPKQLEQRRLSTVEGRACMAHAIAHIEFNAINLALDAAYRFREMPKQYYYDWLSVAADEARHYLLLSDYLQSLGYQYGDFPAHNALWDLAQETAYSAHARMALVPRIMEARGLDVCPSIQEKFASVQDKPMVDILDVIFNEEIRHVQIGNHWFHYLCEQAQVEPQHAFSQFVAKHVKGQIRPPLHAKARKQAGFSEAELDWLQAYIDAKAVVSEPNA